MSVSANPRQKAGQYAKWLSQADKIAPQAPDELYKAYDKAKKDLKPKKIRSKNGKFRFRYK